jgi:photosynthetic reaction center H subunit
MAMAQVSRRAVKVDAVTGAQFAGAPKLKNPDQITLLEEEKVIAYFGAGYLWATPQRSEPIL